MVNKICWVSHNISVFTSSSNILQIRVWGLFFSHPTHFSEYIYSLYPYTSLKNFTRSAMKSLSPSFFLAKFHLLTAISSQIKSRNGIIRKDRLSQIPVSPEEDSGCPDKQFSKYDTAFLILNTIPLIAFRHITGLQC